MIAVGIDSYINIIRNVMYSSESDCETKVSHLTFRLFSPDGGCRLDRTGSRTLKTTKVIAASQVTQFLTQHRNRSTRTEL